MPDEDLYCDVCGVCGNSGTNLRTPVDVCRDCYDVAQGLAGPTAREVEMATSYDSVVRQLTRDLGEVCAERLALQIRVAELETELATMREKYPTAWERVGNGD